MALLGLLGGGAYLAMGRMAAHVEEVQRSEEVLTRLVGALSAVTDAETAVRGFVITGQEPFLEPFDGARARLDQELGEARGRLGGFGARMEQLRELERTIGLRFEEMDRVLSVARREGLSAAQREVVGGQGKRMQDLIRGQILSLRQQEEQAVRDRRDQVRKAMETARAVAVLGSLLAVALAAYSLVSSRREIQARRRAESALRSTLEDLEQRVAQRTMELAESEGRLRLAMEAAQLGSFDWDIPRNRIVWSRQHELLWGFGEGEFDGSYEAFVRRVHPDDRQRVSEEVARCLETRERFASEYRVVWPDGGVHWISGAGEFEYDAGGRPLRMRGVVSQITSRKAAEEQVRTTLESIGDGFFALDRDWRLTYVNTPAVELLGFSREEMVGRIFWEVFPGAVGTRLEQVYRAGAEGRTEDFENFYEPWSRWFRNRVFPREGGGVTVWFQEITAHKKAALALAESEQRAHLAMELARAGTWEWELTSGRNHWSEELWKLYGLEPGLHEPSFEAWQKSVHPEDVGEVMRNLESAVERGEELNLEWRVAPGLVGVGGGDRWLMSRGRPLRDGSGRVIRYLGIVIDISERRRLEEEARRWLTVFHSAQFGLAYAGVTDNCFQGMNEAFARERGYAVEELMGQPFLRIYPPEERAAQKERVQLIDAQGHMVFDSVHQRKDGTKFPVLMEVTVLKDAAGRPQSRVAYALDITERKRAEAALQERNEELVRFIYTVSHDLKSPLVTIRTFLGYLEQDLKSGDAERVAKDLGYMRRAAEKMVNLLEDLLELSRVGRKMNPMEEVTLQALIRDALDLVAGSIAERGVVVGVTEAPVMLTGDRGRLLEVFQNLIDNAVKFMGDQASPRVDIGVEEGAEGLVLFVRDNGIGIDPRHHGKLFGLFEKLHPGTPGTGIGLALVKRIVEVHGGRIWAESGGTGQGTVFRFTLDRLRRISPPSANQG